MKIGAGNGRRMTRSEVKERIATYDLLLLEDASVCVRDYLARENLRANSVDARATAVLGFSATLALALIPWMFEHVGTDTPWAGPVFFAPAFVAAFCGGAYAFVALMVRGEWRRMSDRDLFPRVGKKGPDPADSKRFWLRAHHMVLADTRERCDHKARDLVRAQKCLVAAAVLAAGPYFGMLLRG